MPLYSYRCQSCGAHFDTFAKMSESASPQKCACGEMAGRVITATRISRDLPGYNCPVTGRWVEGRRAHEENLARTGCRVLEEGEARQNEQRREQADRELDRAIEQTVEREIEQMPSAKREKLAAELTGGMELSVDRRTA